MELIFAPLVRSVTYPIAGLNAFGEKIWLTIAPPGK